MAMSPKLPAPAAFRLLSDLNEFFAHPLEERQAAFTDYMTAGAEREAAIEAISQDIADSRADRAAAATAKREADETALAIVSEAQDRAKQIVDVATEQAESVNETVRENVARAKTDTETWGARLKKRESAVQDREDACEVREANAFKEREDAVKLRERAVGEAEKRVKRLETSAQTMKETYEKLMRDINALQRRAPK